LINPFIEGQRVVHVTSVSLVVGRAAARVKTSGRKERNFIALVEGKRKIGDTKSTHRHESLLYVKLAPHESLENERRHQNRGCPL
jgi:hypothetical protein